MCWAMSRGSARTDKPTTARRRVHVQSVRGDAGDDLGFWSSELVSEATVYATLSTSA